MTPSQERKIESLRAKGVERNFTITERTESPDGKIMLIIQDGKHERSELTVYVGRRGGLTVAPLILQEND